MLRLAIDARHIRQLGRELVADKITAVAELIKNAYDADATAVTLRFSGDTNGRRHVSLILEPEVPHAAPHEC